METILHIVWKFCFTEEKRVQISVENRIICFVLVCLKRRKNKKEKKEGR